MKTEKNDSAFASPGNILKIEDWLYEQIPQFGLTKREYFAAMAMQGLFGWSCYVNDGNEKDLAKKSLKCADALIEEFNKDENSE